MTRPDPPISPDQERRLLDYLSGELSEQESRDFEMEILADDSLAERLYALQGIDDLIGSESRQVREAPSTAASRQRSSYGRRIVDWLRPPRVWVPAAAAIALLLTIILPTRLFRGEEPVERMRGPSDRPAPVYPTGELSVPPDRFVWTASAGAAGYQLIVLNDSAARVYETVTHDTTATIPDSVSRTIETATWIVVPRDRKGAELQGSAPATFRVRRR